MWPISWPLKQSLVRSFQLITGWSNKIRNVIAAKTRVSYTVMAITHDELALVTFSTRHCEVDPMCPAVNTNGARNEENVPSQINVNMPMTSFDSRKIAIILRRNNIVFRGSANAMNHPETSETTWQSSNGTTVNITSKISAMPFEVYRIQSTSKNEG